MAAEFYRRSTALYEEFKRRELHYLNVERNYNNSSLSNDINLPLDDYLENINKRERETEKSFISLLQNVEEMDKQTDQMFLKLEKLNALRDAAVYSDKTTWSSMDTKINKMHNKPYYDSAFIQNTPSTSFYRTMNDRTMSTNSIFDYPSRQVDSHSESTQTEHIFCDKCHYPFTRQTIKTISDPVTGLTKQENNNNMDHLDSVLLPPNTNSDISKSIEPSMNPREIVDMQPTTSESVISQAETPYKCQDHRDSLVKTENNINASVLQNLSLNQKALDENKSDYPSNSDVSSKEITNLTKDKVEQTEKNISQNPVKSVTNNNYADKNMERIHDVKNVNVGTSVATDENNPQSKMFETAASKSDDESINHEFDFLDSNRGPSMKNKNIKPESLLSNASDRISETAKQANKDENESKNNPIEASSQSNKYMKPKNGDKDVKHVECTENVLASGDAKIDSSLSEGSPSPAHHSADVSNHSESDSSLEKETPFSASAAYQALLGNTAAPKPIRKAPTPSDSESEDEIENVLSSTVRRTSNINFDGIIQAQKKEEKKASVPETIVKVDKKSSKPATAGSSQSKLSKNTRKVLGLETSSGSEMELEAKESAKKTEEDSDEFDFFN